MAITHHGATTGVTGSCHQLTLTAGAAQGQSILIDCGLFQGVEAGNDGARTDRLNIGFDITHVKALVITHVHIDHIGRLPYLLAAGYQGPLYTSPASAELLPLVIEDALKIGVTRNAALINKVLALIQQRTHAIPFGEWRQIIPDALSIRLQRAGHILGSAYVECQDHAADHRTVFSGDLGASNTPLLPAPQSPERADTLVLESTYGDRQHEDRTTRTERLRCVMAHALKDGGTVLIPAFSIGRTQELLYELEGLFHAEHFPHPQLPVVLDSPLAADFTAGYHRLRHTWDDEAQQRLQQGRHPLAFDQLVTVGSHAEHQRMVHYLAHSGQPAVVIAASGMCAGGRITNYLKAMLGDPRHDILFVGYQAQGTPGRDIQRYGPRGGYVILDGERHTIRAQVHTIGGYSAHADQQDLMNFVTGIPIPPASIRLVHGEQGAKQVLADKLRAARPGTLVQIP